MLSAAFLFALVGALTKALPGCSDGGSEKHVGPVVKMGQRVAMVCARSVPNYIFAHPRVPAVQAGNSCRVRAAHARSASYWGAGARLPMPRLPEDLTGNNSSWRGGCFVFRIVRLLTSSLFFSNDLMPPCVSYA
jgi:hypothetical protein